MVTTSSIELREKREATRSLSLAVSLCPICHERALMNVTSREFTCKQCARNWYVDNTVECPHFECRRSFTFFQQCCCPVCQGRLADGVPLRPASPKLRLVEVLSPRRRHNARLIRERAATEFQALQVSWSQDSALTRQACETKTSRFARDLANAYEAHAALLERFHDDIEKFLYAAPIRLAKYESNYSWIFDEQLSGEIDRLLDGVLSSYRTPTHNTLGFIARCGLADALFSRQYLTDELRRRFNEKRVTPKPGFQLTLEYARTLGGVGFEDWLVQLLRDGGVTNVSKTKASHDQGADVVVTIGTRKIVLQAKNYQEVLGNKAIQEVVAARLFYTADEAWVVTTSIFSKDALDLAQRTGVQLVDGARLLSLPVLIGGPSFGEKHNSNESQPDSSNSIAVSTGCDASSLDSKAEPAPLQQAPIACPATSASAAPQSIAPGTWRRFITRRFFIGASVLVAILIGTTTYMWYQRKATQDDIRTLLASYQTAVQNRDAVALAKCYAPIVDHFYAKGPVTRGNVETEFRRQFAAYNEVKRFALSPMYFTRLPKSQVSAEIDREWSFSGKKSFSGRELEELTFVQVDGQWRISSEIERKVYWRRKTQ
jgi:Restriction endonuclease